MANTKLHKLEAILKMKCPKCHEGDLFDTGTWAFDKPFDMPRSCSKCGQNYFPEPGFYYGAMFISYIFWGWFCIIFGFASIVGLGMTVNQATLLLTVITAICFVWLFRISRSIWIHIAIRKKTKNISLKG